MSSTTLQYPPAGANPSRVLTDSYGSGNATSNEINQLASIIDGTGTTGNVTLGATLDTLGYLGDGAIVSETYSGPGNEPNVGYNLLGTTNGQPDLDRFGRIVDQIWSDYGAGGKLLDGYGYTYNLQGDVAAKQNLAADAYSGAPSLDEAYKYNRQDEVTALDRGELTLDEDGNNNVTAVTDPSGNVLERYVYSAYGSVTMYDGPTSPGGDWSNLHFASSQGNTVLFAGMLLDPTTGQYYDNARWYNSSTGGFITRDPAQSDPNLYRYAENDPIDETDPSGLIVANPGSGSTASWTAPTNSCSPTVGGVSPTLSGYDPYANAYASSSGTNDSTASTTPGPVVHDPLPPLDRAEVQNAQNFAAVVASQPLPPLPAPVKSGTSNPGNTDSISALPPVGLGEAIYLAFYIPLAKMGQAIASPIRLIDTNPNSGVSQFFAPRDKALDYALLGART